MNDYRKSPEHKLALNTFIKLQRCANSVVNDVHSHLQHKLTVSQFGILEALYHLGPMCQKELAEKILKSAGNITTVINNLEKNNLVRREVLATDKRSFAVSLTKEGRHLIESIFPAHAELIRKRLSVLNHAEQNQLGALLKKLSMCSNKRCKK